MDRLIGLADQEGNRDMEPAHAKPPDFGKPLTSFGKYRDLEQIGSGGMAHVYRAYDSSLQRTIALKLMDHTEAKYSERLLRESRSQAKLDHPHICKIFEAGEQYGRAYIAMQYIPGKTLKDVSQELTLEQKVDLVRRIAEALHEAHRSGIIHRDIKPTNVMVETRDGSFYLYVVDFGLAREIHSEGLTQTKAVIGTPLYMSPEQVLGNTSGLDRRTDVYSLGVTLYELLSGKVPFTGGSSHAVLKAILEDDPETFRKKGLNVPADLESIVMKCLEKDPARRYESAKSLAEDLRRYLDGAPVNARPQSWRCRTDRKDAYLETQWIPCLCRTLHYAKRRCRASG
ncbi:serine/threonine protein kinase, partial [bacterium]|nr:serine/threonine protein kinase [bacterium]MCI0602116.1 serine/threonine protein kinase [bacterium]